MEYCPTYCYVVQKYINKLTHVMWASDLATQNTHKNNVQYNSLLMLLQLYEIGCCRGCRVSPLVGGCYKCCELQPLVCCKL